MRKVSYADAIIFYISCILRMEIIMEENVVFSTEDVQNNRIFGILAYLGILVLVPILAAKDSPYARFHANQGLVFLITAIAANIAIGICRFAFIFIPIIGTIFSAILMFIVGVACLILLIIGIINACSDEAKKLPVIGGITILK